MATTYNAPSVANTQASPPTISDLTTAKMIKTSDILATTTAMVGTTANKIYFCVVPSNAVVTAVNLLNTALDSNGTPALTFDLRVYYLGDAVASPTAVVAQTFGTEVGSSNPLASASTALQTARTTGLNLRNATDPITSRNKCLWDQQGLTSDPGGHFMLGLKIGTIAATGATGTIVLDVDYLLME